MMNGYGKRDPSQEGAEEKAETPTSGNVWEKLRRELGMDGDVIVTIGGYVGNGGKMQPANNLKPSFGKGDKP
jgi:hypothetical protein